MRMRNLYLQFNQSICMHIYFIFSFFFLYVVYVYIYIYIISRERCVSVYTDASRLVYDDAAVYIYICI